MTSPTVQTPTVSRVAAWSLDAAGTLSGPGPFPDRSYSLMKHGSSAASADLAAAVVAAVRSHPVHADLVGPRPPVFLVASTAVAPACDLLSRQVLEAVNADRARLGHDPGVQDRVVKGTVTATDYATASAEARSEELRRLEFRLPERELAGRCVVVVDDARITGAAERRMAGLIATAAPASLVFAYVLEVDEARGRARPSIERDLNTAAVTGPLDLVPTVIDGGWVTTIRFLKLLLRAPEAEQVEFLSRIGPAAAERLVAEARANAGAMPALADRLAGLFRVFDDGRSRA